LPHRDNPRGSGGCGPRNRAARAARWTRMPRGAASDPRRGWRRRIDVRQRQHPLQVVARSRSVRSRRAPCRSAQLTDGRGGGGGGGARASAGQVRRRRSGGPGEQRPRREWRSAERQPAPGRRSAPGTTSSAGPVGLRRSGEIGDERRCQPADRACLVAGQLANARGALRISRSRARGSSRRNRSAAPRRPQLRGARRAAPRNRACRG